MDHSKLADELRFYEARHSSIPEGLLDQVADHIVFLNEVLEKRGGQVEKMTIEYRGEQLPELMEFFTQKGITPIEWSDGNESIQMDGTGKRIGTQQGRVQILGQSPMTYWDIYIDDAGAKKISVIKEIRAITNLGLKDAKDLVDKPGSCVARFVSDSDASRIVGELERAGATIRVERA